MTIAIRVELKEDWGQNTPCVIVEARTLRGPPHQVAVLTPQNPVATVCITRDQDLHFAPSNHSAGLLLENKRPAEGT